LSKKLFPHVLIILRRTSEFAYLGEFEFILKNNLGSGDQVRAFNEEKKQKKKISYKCAFKQTEANKHIV
jgi:hypothetical protein